MEVIRDQFELSIESGIDSVHITDGWIKYAKEIPPEPEKRKSITLSSDSVSIVSDSSAWVSIHTTAIDSANIKRGVFSFAIDTSVLRFDTAVVGSAFEDSALLTVENKVTRMNLFLSGIDSTKKLSGEGEIIKIRFTARNREDTVATYLFDSSFFALNTDNLLDSVRYELKQILVYSIPSDTDTVIKSVRLNQDSPRSFQLVPNPANEFVNIAVGREDVLTLYTLLGIKVYESNVYGSTLLDVRTLPSGLYQAVVGTGVHQQRSILQVQH
jgi:hypothetical protein